MADDAFPITRVEADTIRQQIALLRGVAHLRHGDLQHFDPAEERASWAEDALYEPLGWENT